jgi:hypothetical protein
MTPAFELFPKSYHLVRKNIWVFVTLCIFPLIIGLSNGVWVVDSQRHFHTDAPVIWGAIGTSTLPAYAWGGFGITLIFAMVLAIILQIMTQAAQLDVSMGKSANLSRAWKVVKARGLQMLGLYLLVGLITAVGFVLFIIPGIIMLRRYFVAPYVLLENKEMGVWDAMEKSAQLTKQDPWSVYSILGLMLLFSLFGVFPIIGWIAAFLLHFFYSVAPAIRYQELKKIN